ncbi:bifunctional 2-keto-4-hydroxyglutarate aldolase/2-keto-3-deoxy-6-phosphogluconate aldolase [Dubosiella muris]|uniref:Bifunctional 4-hydroxy-2-oxoglutarate aldolase/2-dehydro-3-deoxy-phosphogluconate aldolase n=1 Tax=Dubosiella muris TaxID=3038133 RepID=A0AC61R5N3_9FIRM|nr:bifunctional 2-keto-4-hydroxyglutarate aldolase/2-keto-3-deoxy-6-phosphogluconate aldolase [Dubosiella muris]TGY65189.1 bifunctional 4-hydroxy-2-oxoglutarate aldolase/2-dehydro-3-deoxy-phosphogluconate aldolase [Dubosiella muris]
MGKLETIQTLKKEKLVAVIRGAGFEEVNKMVDAIYKGGIHLMEITFTIPHAEQVIAKIKEANKDKPDMVVGAGTVLDIVSARLAILAGADFVVCPHFDKDIMKLCNLYQIPCFPGAVTVKEIADALQYGADIIKLFPGELYGAKAIKAFHGPLPQAQFMPTGGVSADNLKDWLDQGAVAVGLGGSLTKGAKTGDFDAVTNEAKKLVEIIAGYRA